MIGRTAGPRTLLLGFGLLSLAAVALGAVAGAVNGVPAEAWTRNLAAWLVGAMLAAGLSHGRRPRWRPAMLWMAPAGLAATFLSPAQQGVHRWLDVGPVHANLAMLLTPGAIVALAALASGRRWPWLAAFATLALLSAQPDASQATAFGAAAAVIAFAAIRIPAMRLAALGGILALVVVAWLRPDPLQPVPEVEGVIELAYRLSPAVAGLALLCLLAVVAAPAVLTRSFPAARLAGWALGASLLVWAAAPFFGAFPVPFAGIGPSPVLGAWLGIGLLAALMRPVAEP